MHPSLEAKIQEINTHGHDKHLPKSENFNDGRTVEGSITAAGTPGTHAEVLAANDVLNFKTELRKCSKTPDKCLASFKKCFNPVPTPPCSNIEGFESVRFDSGRIEKCLKPKSICFPGDKVYIPSDLFFDIRGSNKKKKTHYIIKT